MYGHFTERGPIPRGRTVPTGNKLVIVEAPGHMRLESLTTTTAQSASARAAWSHSTAPNNHAYSLSVWNMKGSEQVEGELTYEYSEQINDYEWQTEPLSFVSHETWLSFHSQPNAWIEVGQLAGEGDCCTLRQFAAYTHNGGTGLNVVTNLSASKPYYTWNLYQTSGQSHDGHWCPYWDSSQVACWGGGFPSWATQLETGMEVLATSGSRPTAKITLRAGGAARLTIGSTIACGKNRIRA